MRIALVITELDPGGAELCLTELALYLGQLGHSVKIWSIGPPPPVGRDGLVQRLKTAAIDVRFGEARGALDTARVARWLTKELLEFRPDIVQSMLWHANLLTALALWTNRIPWIAGMRVSEPRSGRWWLERLASRRMQHLVCVSRDVYEHARTNERIAQDKLVIIPNGVEDRWFEKPLMPQTWTELSDRTVREHVLLFVGRLESQKGILPMMDHIQAVLDGHEDWSWMLMGQGSLQEALQAKIETLGLEQQVQLVGWQPDAPSWMRAADVLLLPAQYEGMPNVLLEAMAVGKPFVAFAVDGVGELLDRASGYPAELAAAQLASPGDWSEFVRLVRAQMAQAALRERCGQANRKHAAEHFRLHDQLQKYVQLYESCLT